MIQKVHIAPGLPPVPSKHSADEKEITREQLTRIEKNRATQKRDNNSLRKPARLINQISSVLPALLPGAMWSKIAFQKKYRPVTRFRAAVPVLRLQSFITIKQKRTGLTRWPLYNTRLRLGRFILLVLFVEINLLFAQLVFAQSELLYQVVGVLFQEIGYP